jgi:K(+)-stimulated pyrophosphate-energized sodium pump
MTIGWTIFVLGLLSLAVSGFFAWRVLRIPPTQGAATPEQAERMLGIWRAIQEGAMAFLLREYRYMAVFMAGFGVLVWLLVDWESALAFLIGASISISAGFIGMRAATAGNVRTAAAARSSMSRAFRIAFNSGAVMGFALVGMAVLGLIVTHALLDWIMGDAAPEQVMEALAGFGLGGSSIALFARVGGGIYTKAADVGADLVGKVEENIPEDDPRNPAVIADNVGDNVGDVAGMGADLFGSVAESTCAALVIGAVSTFSGDGPALLYPLLISAVGIPVAFVGTFFAWAFRDRDVEPALKRALVISTILMAVAMAFVTLRVLPEQFLIGGVISTNLNVYYCLLAGLISGMLIGLVTEYFTSNRFSPVRQVARASETGAATNIIYGLALGYQSAMLPVLFIAVTVFLGYYLAGMYGIAIASLGMLGTIAVSLTMDAYGPVSDNAGGIAEMSALGPDVRKRTDALDAAGNTTAAIGKGFAIGSAVLTALALFSAFLVRSGVDSLDLLKPVVIAALFVGALSPFVFSAITMKSVGKAALDMIKEVRRQFNTIPGLRDTLQYTPQSLEALAKLKGVTRDHVTRLRPLVGRPFGKAEALLAEARKLMRALPALPDDVLLKPVNLGFVPGRPDYRTCVDISTRASLREMILPGAQVILTPIVVGWLFGPEAVAGVLIGAMTSGVVLATASANSGGGWDNAKKFIESGQLGGKGSDVHRAAVVGDTVGDPLKDTTGPSLNILIKLMAIISLVFAPFFQHSLRLLG